MRLPRTVVGILFFALLAGTSPLVAQATLAGVVRDSAGQPLPRVQIIIEGTSLQASSDTNGRFTISNVPARRGSALFRSVGYRPVRVVFIAVKGKTVRAEPVLIRAAVELEPIVVQAAPAGPRGSGAEGFEERRRMGLGKFIDSAELRRSDQVRPADVLRRAQTGIRLTTVTDNSGDHIWAESSLRNDPVTGQHCYSQVYLDGIPVFRPGMARVPFDFANDIRVSELQAVEVYRSNGETPMEFSGVGADCGTIVLWTRRSWDVLAGASASPSGTAAGRRRVGLFFGMNFATLAGSGANQFGERRHRTSGLGGITVETPIGARWTAGPELFFTSKGVKGTSLNGSADITLDFIELPMVFKLHLLGSRTIRPTVHGGPFIAFRMSCRANLTTPFDSAPVNCAALDLNRGLDWGVQVGSGLHAGPFFLGVRYDFGLENLNGGSDGGPIRTRSLAVVSGVAFRTH